MPLTLQKLVFLYEMRKSELAVKHGLLELRGEEQSMP